MITERISVGIAKTIAADVRGPLLTKKLEKLSLFLFQDGKQKIFGLEREGIGG